MHAKNPTSTDECAPKETSDDQSTVVDLIRSFDAYTEVWKVDIVYMRSCRG